MKKQDKTNVMRLLDAAKIDYGAHYYKPDPTMTGEQIAEILNEETDRVFKTLVTRGKSGSYYVFVIPVAAELNLKKAAKVSGFRHGCMRPPEDNTFLSVPVRSEHK